MRKIIYIIAALWFYLVGTAQAQFDWEFMAPMPDPRSGMCSVVLHGQIYVIGGRDSTGNILNSTLIYTPFQDTWQTGDTLQIARENAAAVVKNDTIFVIGGRNAADEIEDSVEFYAAASNEWLPYVAMQQRREGLSAVVLRNSIYAIGGLTQATDGAEMLIDAVERYNDNSTRWEIVENWQLQEGLASFAAVTFGDSAFVIGGFSNLGPLGFVQRFHPDFGAASRAPLINARGGHAAVENQIELMVTGGRNAGNSVIASVEVFNFVEGAWQEKEPLRTRRENHTAAALDDYAYVIGGLDAFGNALASVEARYFPNAITSVVSESDAKPESFSLKQNYPNPFNAGSVITFTVPDANEVTDLSIYNLQGQLVKNLVHVKIAAGEHKVHWDGKDSLGNEIASAIYIYTIRQGNLKISKKMLLVR